MGQGAWGAIAQVTELAIALPVSKGSDRLGGGGNRFSLDILKVRLWVWDREEAVSASHFSTMLTTWQNQIHTESLFD
jgi:hypothetical protein